jgi:hypothetical protein
MSSGAGFFFVWGPALWGTRCWEVLGEFAAWWWFLLGREVVEAVYFLEGAEGGREVGVVAAKEGVSE